MLKSMACTWSLISCSTMHCWFCCCWHHHWNMACWIRNSGTEFKSRTETIPLLAWSDPILNLTKSPEIIKTNQLTESEFSSLCNQYNQTVNDPNFTEDQLDSLVGMMILNETARIKWSFLEDTSQTLSASLETIKTMMSYCQMERFIRGMSRYLLLSLIRS